MASIGHPVLGDSLYGKAVDYIDGHALHCFRLSFIHPITNKYVKLESEPTSWGHLKNEIVTKLVTHLKIENKKE